MRQSGPFLQSGASLIRWTSGHHLWSPWMTSCCTSLRTRSYSPVLLMDTGLPLLINWVMQQSISARMITSLVSWKVFTEIDPKGGGEYPPGTFPWYYTSWQRLLSNLLGRHLWSIWPSKLSSFWPWALAKEGVRSMHGSTRTSDTSPIGPRCPCFHLPAFFPRISWPKRVRKV